MCVAQKECFWVCDKSFHHVPSHGKHHCNGRSNSNKGTNNIRGVHIKSKRHGETDRQTDRFRENKGIPFLYGFTETPTRRMLRLTIIWPTVYVPSAIAHHQDHRLMWGVDLFANCRYRRTFGKETAGKAFRNPIPNFPWSGFHFNHFFPIRPFSKCGRKCTTERPTEMQEY